MPSDSPSPATIKPEPHPPAGGLTAPAPSQTARGRRSFPDPDAITPSPDKPWSLGMDAADKKPAMVYGPSRGRQKRPPARSDDHLYTPMDIMGRWKPMALRKMTGRARYQLPLTWGNTLEDKLMSYRRG